MSATRSRDRDPPVPEAREVDAPCRGLERPHVRGGARPDDREQPLDRLQHARDAAERERRRAEADDFAIVGALEAPDDVNRIGGRIWVVEIGVQPIEGCLEK